LKDISVRTSLRPWLVLLAAFAQILASFLPERMGWGASIAEQSARYQTPAVPIGFAFAIWGLIFAASLAFAIYGLMQKNRHNELLSRIAWSASLLFMLNALWEIYVPVRSIDLWSLAIIIAATVTAISIILKIARHAVPLTAGEKWLVAIPMQIFAGWLTAATFVGIPSVMLRSGVDFVNPRSDTVVILMLAGATAVALYVINRTRAVAYAVTILWAIAGVVAANIFRESHPTIVAAAVTAALVVIASALFTVLKEK
jgi:ABC-type uncharacterized transport system fused permease/ATPase subunit